MKFMTTKCRTRLAIMKSPNARSGLMLANWLLFCSLVWMRRHTNKKKRESFMIITFIIIAWFCKDCLLKVINRRQKFQQIRVLVGFN